MLFSHVVFQVMEGNGSFAVHYDTLGAVERAVLLMKNYGVQVHVFCASGTIVLARYGSPEMFDEGLQLCVCVITYLVLAYSTSRIPGGLAQVAHVVAVLAHPDRGPEELVAGLAA